VVTKSLGLAAVMKPSGHISEIELIVCAVE
jgi:hypothetical protein